MHLWETDDDLIGAILYHNDIYREERIAEMAQHFLTLIEGIVANPNLLLSELPLLTVEENENLIVAQSDRYAHPGEKQEVYETGAV